MLRAVADTHAVIWYLYDDSRLSEQARTLFEEVAAAGDQVGVSAITLAEMVYLSEKGRLPTEALERVLTAIGSSDIVIRELPVDRLVVGSMRLIDRTEI